MPAYQQYMSCKQVLRKLLCDVDAGSQNQVGLILCFYVPHTDSVICACSSVRTIDP